MAILGTLLRLTWSGTLGSAEDEIFSYTRHGAYMEGNTDLLPGVADTAANDVTDFLAESTTGGVAFTTIGQAFPTSVQWTQLKVYEVDPVTGDATTEPEVRVLTDAGSATGVPFLTNQDAFAVTTQKLPRDKRSRNRFYLPTMQAGVLDSVGRVRGTFVDDMQTQLKFSDHAHKADDLWTYVVYSPTSHLFTEIDRYFSGDVMDTIRRRRNKLVETRHPLAG
jgi:hypothetical protein